MDYQLNIYPSSAKELQNIKADNSTKQIKVMQAGQLKQLYQKAFGPAVKKYNERAMSARLIDNYLKSITDSNVPEVYKLSLVIRYELQNKVEIAAIQKAFADFKKLLDKKEALCVVSCYSLSYDEYKELMIFFFPISSGYSTGLTVRNDLIDITKKLTDTKQNINLAQAIPLLEKHLVDIFDKVNNGQFITQEELEALAKRIEVVDPMQLHAIAVETLKAQMNNLQRVNEENKRLQEAIQREKERIQHDIDWSREMEQKIYAAEEERIAEEARIAEEKRQAEEARRIAEAIKREEERLRAEERRIEAERLAAQARRNIELRRQMALQEEEERRRRESRQQVDQDTFATLVEQHLEWQDVYQINKDSVLAELPEYALEDERRLYLSGADISQVRFDDTLKLIGVHFEDCAFMECACEIELVSSTIKNCKLINCEMNEIELSKCTVEALNAERLTFGPMLLQQVTVMNSHFAGAAFHELLSAPATSFIRCDFSDAMFVSSDMKQNGFMNCNFSNTLFKVCDVRDSAFQLCDVSTIVRKGSLFKGAKFK